MSNPTKRRGRRTIAIGTEHYRWKVWPSSPNSRLVVTSVKNGGQRLEVTLIGWQDPWFAINGIKVEGDSMTLFTEAENVPTVIASGFVRALIEFGLKHNRNPKVPGRPIRVEYQAGTEVLSGAGARGSGEELIATRRSDDTRDGSPEVPESTGATEKKRHVLTRATRIYLARE